MLGRQHQSDAQEDTNSFASFMDNEFAWKLFRNTKVSTKDTENLVLSPLTVQFLLSILQYAAEGCTKEQLKNVTYDVNPTQIYYILNRVGNPAEIKSATGIFIDSNDKFNENTLLRIVANGGEILTVPFQNNPGKTKHYINSWALNATEGHISEFLTSENDVSNLKILLASATYFQSSWKHHFRPSQPRQFYNSFNEEILTDFIHANSYFKMNNVDLGKNNWGTVINLPYKENRYSMFLIIPEPLTTLNTFVGQMSARKFYEIIKHPSQLPSTKLKLFMPKFKISSKISLVSALQEMGLVDIFSQSKSGLTKLFDGQESPHINEILQQSTLEVDQFGTTATSATAVSVVPLSAAEAEPKVLIINSPFLAVIVETANATPVFIARIANPSSTS